MALSERMECLLHMMPHVPCIADIGCDHAFVSIELIRRGIADRVIAADINAGPLEKAREHIREAGLEEWIEVRQSDGLSTLNPGEADGMILAGMGGRLMQKILTEGRECVAKMQFMVLQPQSEIEEFRRFLRQNGLRIRQNEILTEDHKNYFPMLVVHAEEPEAPKPADMEVLEDRYGADLLKEDRGLGEILRAEAEELQRIIDGITSVDGAAERIAELEERLRINRMAAEMLNAKQKQNRIFVKQTDMAGEKAFLKQEPAGWEGSLGKRQNV